MEKDLKIIHWPDPRLLKISKPVEAFDEELRSLVARMLDLMRQDRGVGLAAPQVGVNLRLFVMNHSGQPGDDRAYINPVLSNASGSEVGEEGCLSLPNITAKVERSTQLHMSARDVAGNAIEEDASGYIARIWQHEFDHLNGTLLLDRMGSVAKMGIRKILKELKEEYEQSSKPALARPVRV